MSNAPRIWNELFKTLFTASILITAALAFVHLLKFGSIFAFPLACCMATPLYVSSLNNHLYTGLIALFITIAGLWLSTGPLYTLIHTSLFLLPAFFGAALLYFTQIFVKRSHCPRPTLPIIFFDLLCLNIILVSALLLTLEHFPAFKLNLQQAIMEKINFLVQLSSSYSIDETLHSKFMDAKQLLAQHFDIILGNILAIYGLFFTLSNLYFATLFIRKLNKQSLKRFFWPEELFLPLSSLLLLPIFLLGSIIHTSHAIELVSNIGLVSLIAGFFASGLAYLHHFTRYLSGRIFLLTLIYIALFSSVIFTAPIFITLTLMGIWATLKHYRQYKYFI